MSYDESLAERVRVLMSETPDVTERKMFGGLAFLIDGHMAVVVSGQGGLMIRINPARGDHLAATTPARLAVMRGREMRGWLRLADEQVESDGHLSDWVDMSTAFTQALPPKH